MQFQKDRGNRESGEDNTQVGAGSMFKSEFLIFDGKNVKGNNLLNDNSSNRGQYIDKKNNINE